MPKQLKCQAGCIGFSRNALLVISSPSAARSVPNTIANMQPVSRSVE
jgi:hypothetical protein